MPPAHRSRVSAFATVSAVAILTVACNSRSSLKANADASTGQTGGSPGAGGAGSGGIRGSGGTSDGGGIVGSGGMPASDAGGLTSLDAVVGGVCGEDGGRGLPGAARRCTRDEECTIATAHNCCSPDEALGVAVSQVDAYLGCLMRIGLCGGLCGTTTKDYRYVTDTGRLTPTGSAGAMPIGSVGVRCLNRLCTTDIADAFDGGRDLSTMDATPDAPALDVAADAVQPCGDAACGAGQACVLIVGGAVPPCEAPTDAGGCPAGLVLVSSCSGYGAAVEQRPGCSMAPPRPTCYTLPDACSNICSCMCGGGGAGCYRTGDYFTCAMP